MDKKSSILEITQGLTNILMDYKEKAFEDIDSGELSIHFYNYINVIDELDNPTFSDLAKKLDLSKPAITAIVNKLIEQDIVFKSQSVDDRRVYFVHLTEKGKRLSDIYQTGYLNFADYVVQSLTDEELEQFIKISRRIISGKIRKGKKE